MRTMSNRRFRTNHVWMGTAIVAALVVGVVLGSALTTRSEAAQPPPTLTFTGNEVIVVNYVNSANTADYERFMRAYGETLAASSDAQRARMGAGFEVYRAAEAGPGNTAVYLQVLDPAVPGGDYQHITVLAEEYAGGPPGNGDEVRELYAGYTSSLAPGAYALNLTSVMEF